MTEFLRRISLWLVPCSVCQNGLWGFCKTRQGPRQLPCLPLVLHWTILNSEFLKPATCRAHLYVWCLSAFSWAGPRWVQHHIQRQILSELISEFYRWRNAVYYWWHMSHICVGERVRSQEPILKLEQQLYKKRGTEVKVDNTSYCLATRVSHPPFIPSNNNTRFLSSFCGNKCPGQLHTQISTHHTPFA